VVTSHKSAHHTSHKADIDFPALLQDSEGQMLAPIKFKQRYKLGGGAVVKEFHYAMKKGST
jgi:hypothetical protein